MTSSTFRIFALEIGELNALPSAFAAKGAAGSLLNLPYH
jgi:hypothetical protein